MNAMLTLYNEAHDYPTWQGDPNKVYIIAASPRSGSTLLSTLLWRTGSLGAPLEYINPRLVLEETRGEPCLNYQYWRKTIAHRTSPNGVFGLKLFQRHMRDLAATEPAILAELAPQFVIRLKRADVAQHAVSYWRALKGQSWFYGLPEQDLPAYRYEDVRDAEVLIANQQKFWDRLLQEAPIQQIPVFYEELIDAPERVIDSVLNAMGEVRDRSLVTVALPKRQRDGLSDQICEAYGIDRSINRGLGNIY